MNFTFEDGTIVYLPDGLADIPVETMQMWSAAYGHQLTLRGLGLQSIEDEGQKALTRSLLFMDEVTMALAFWTNMDLDDIRAELDLGVIVTLLSQSQIALAIQGTHTPLPGYEAAQPASVTIGVNTYEVYSPVASVNIDSLSHDEFLVTLQLARYLLELTEGNWEHFTSLLAGYCRLPGEVLTMDLIDPAGARVGEFAALRMQDGMGLAQYFIRETPGVLEVLDAYTSQQLSTLSP